MSQPPRSRRAGKRSYPAAFLRGVGQTLLDSGAVMRSLPVLLLALLAGPAAAQKPGAAIRCQEDHTVCKEDCTIEFGGSSRTYHQLGTCLQKCQATFDVCKERHFSLQQHQGEPVPPSSPPPPPEEPPSLSSAGPDSSEEPASSERKGVYRASGADKPRPPEEEPLEPLPEEAAAPAPAPPPRPEPKRPGAPQESKPGAKAAPKTEKEAKPPKTKDLSEWDPSGK
jgi:hypothetical protein